MNDDPRLFLTGFLMIRKTDRFQIPSMEPEVRARQEAENREFEERKARIAEILARSRATVQEVKSESSQRMPTREGTNGNGNGNGNLSKSNGHSSDEDLNGYGRFQKGSNYWYITPRKVKFSKLELVHFNVSRERERPLLRLSFDFSR